MRNQHEMQAVNELSASQPSCFNCQSNSHPGEYCQEHAHILNQNKPPTNAPYGDTYNPNWRNHPNLSYKPKIPAYIPIGAQQQFGSTSTQQQLPPLTSPVEQAILNLSKVVRTFVEEQKVLNVQTNQKIEAVESSLNRKLDNMHSEISRLSKQQLQVSEKGNVPSQSQQHQKGVHEIGSTNDLNVRIDKVKAVMTLRSGKELRPAVPAPAKSAPTVADPPQEEQSSNREEVKTTVPPPFPQALRKKKNSVNQTEMLEVLRQVKVNIPLLDMIKQVPTYAKFLKDLCTVKRGFNVNKKAFLTEQVSAIIECKTPVKYKDLGCPTISVNIRGISVEKALLDLGASVNLLPYSMYQQLGLGELKPTSITLSLVDRSIQIPKGTIEDVLIQVDKFYYPVDFVVLDIEPVAVGANHVPIILGRPFLGISNAIINCRNGIMQLTFGNMTLELNIFHLSKRHMHSEEDDCEEVCIIDAILEEQANEQQVQDVLTLELSECLGEQQEPHCMSLVQGYWRRKIELLPLLTGDEPREPQQLELKPLPVELKYAFLEENGQCPIVISSLLTNSQELAPSQKEQASIGVENFLFKRHKPNYLHPSHLPRRGAQCKICLLHLLLHLLQLQPQLTPLALQFQRNILRSMFMSLRGK